MEREFIPYEQAVALKELGFDEKCLSCYLYEVETFSWELNYQISNNSIPWIISAPLYQQAFSFLLNIIKDVSITYWNDESGNLKYFGQVVPFYDFDTKEECLSILIEIAKKN